MSINVSLAERLQPNLISFDRGNELIYGQQKLLDKLAEPNEKSAAHVDAAGVNARATVQVCMSTCSSDGCNARPFALHSMLELIRK